MVVLGLLFLLGSVVAFGASIGLFSGEQRRIRRRLAAISRPVSTARRADAPGAGVRFQDRAEGAFVKWLTTPTLIAKVERNLVLAGSPDEWPLSKVLSFKLLSTLLGAAVLVLQLSKGFSLFHLLTGVLGLAVGYLAADVIVQGLARRRQEAIQKELPDVLDQVTISLEAGLGFEAALAHIGQRRTGPIADELVRTVQDMQLGVSRRDAYQSLADRTDVEDLDRFVRALAQADQHGISISQVVKTQANEMRFTRRKRAEAKAAKVPVKILFPLMICILPVLFAVILTPAAMSISRAL